MTVPETLSHLLGRGAPRAPDQSSLEAWGQALGAVLPRPVVVTFAGDLGAGKTTLVRSICRGLGVRDMAMVTSPTFSLIQQYDAMEGSVTHVDLYRLRSARELDTLGWDELVDTASVLLVEWPDRAGDAIPTNAISIELRHDSAHPDRRLLVVKSPRA